jgi:hypothetical protein
MPTPGDEDRRLRELHDAYAWEVNAAIEEGREDLVWRLVDDYLVQVMAEMTGAYENACERPNCAVCARPPAPSRRTGRAGRLGGFRDGWRRLVTGR